MATRTPSPPRTASAGTLAAIFRERCRADPSRIALREKRLGVWRAYTWAEYYERVRDFALGLVAIGVQPGDRVAVHSEDRPEWLFAELGSVCAGATSVGIYPTNPAAEVEYILSHSGARVLVAEDQEQVDKALAVAHNCPALERIVVIDDKGLRDYDDPKLMRFDEVLAAGRTVADGPARFERMVDERSFDEIAMIVYTSGTTGPPKGAMLSHRNLAAAVRISSSIWAGSPDDRILSYLPLCHVAEKIFSIFIPLSSGASASFAESIDTVMQNLTEVEPTIFLGVPRIWEKLAASIQIRMRDASTLKRANFALWMRLGERLADAWLAAGGRYRYGWKVAYVFGWLFLYRSLQRKMGLGRCHTAVSGAAPIAPEILRFFHAIGIHVREGWGMTESCGIGTITRPDDVRLGTVGAPLEDVELRIDPVTGEILVRGDFVFAGYYRNDEATRATIDDQGWLHTGDVGTLDERGHLSITDRMKDIIITAGGKNLSPSEIENALKISPYIREAAVVGDRRPYLTALIGIELDTVADWAQRRGIGFTTYRDLTEKDEVVELVSGEVRKANEGLAQVETIKKFRLLPKELDHEDGELTATQKVKRRTLEERFADLVESMYRS